MPGYDWMWWGPLTNQNLVRRCAEVHVVTWKCTTVCPPLSMPGLPSNGHQAHADLVTGPMLLHPLHNILQMAASWMAT